VPLVWIVAGVAALAAGIQAAEGGTESAGQRLRELANQRVAPRILSTAGRDEMHSHPADPYLPIQVARGLVLTQPRLALRYLNRALWLDPRSGAAHLLTGRALLRLGHARQAALHYRAAVRWDPTEARLVAREVATFVRDPNLALRLVPCGEGALVVLRALSEAYLDRGDAETAVTLARALARRNDAGSPQKAFLVRVLVGVGRPEEAISLARTTHGKEGQCEAALWESVALENLGRGQEGRSVLRAAARECPDNPGIRERLVLVAVDTGDFATAEEALAMYRGVVGASDDAIAQASYLEGRMEAARHRDARAAAAFTRAAELAPRNPTYLEAASRSWEGLGRADRAEPLRRALSRLPR
jgi:tetratricopeptide (TPR) repeat protein